MIESFRFLLENRNTQNKALVTLIGLLKVEDSYDVTEFKYEKEEWVIS
jgi:hypothetical protein